MRTVRQSTTLAFLASISLVVAFAGCGGGTGALPTSAVAQHVTLTNVNGQYDLVLTSTNGQGTTNIYTEFTQSGTTVTGTANTLVCPSNDPSQCKDDGLPVISISGTTSGTDFTIEISFPDTAGPDTVTMIGSTTRPVGIGGTYTDSLGDSGTWVGSATATQSLPQTPTGFNYSGMFNSTSNPLLIAPTILLELAQGANSNLTGTATVMNSPCISSLTLSGQEIGDAFSLTDAARKVVIIALPSQPTLPTGNNFSFSYQFEPTAPSCAGDFGSGVLTLVPSAGQGTWDY